MIHIIITDLFYPFFGKPCLTGRVETYVASEATVCHPRIAQASHLAQIRRQRALLPQLRIKFAEAVNHIWGMCEHVAKIRHLAGYRRFYSRRC